MFVHVKQYEVAATARVLKDVTCEFCGTTFHYAFRSFGRGTGHAVYGIGADMAADRALNAAASRAKSRARIGLAPVACPKCGKLQNEMVQELKRRVMRNASTLGVHLPLFLLGAVVCVALLVTNFGKEPITRGWLVGLVVTAIIAFLLAAHVGLGAWRESQSLACNYFGRQEVPVGAIGAAAEKSVSVIAESVPKASILK
jgi:hypothetical protein